MGTFGLEVLSESAVSFSCDCDRERFAQHIRSLAEREPDVLDQPRIDVQCSFCGAAYEFDPDELREPTVH